MSGHRIEVRVFDAEGKPFGAVSEDVAPEKVERVAVEMARSAALPATDRTAADHLGFDQVIAQTTDRPATPEEFEAVCEAEGIGPPDGEG